MTSVELQRFAHGFPHSTEHRPDQQKVSRCHGGKALCSGYKYGQIVHVLPHFPCPCPSSFHIASDISSFLSFTQVVFIFSPSTVPANTHSLSNEKKMMHKISVVLGLLFVNGMLINSIRSSCLHHDSQLPSLREPTFLARLQEPSL